MKFFTKANIILIASMLALPRVVDGIMLALHYPDSVAIIVSGNLMLGLAWLLCYQVYRYVYLKRFLWRNIVLVILLMLSVFCLWSFASILFPSYVHFTWERAY